MAELPDGFLNAMKEIYKNSRSAATMFLFAYLCSKNEGRGLINIPQMSVELSVHQNTIRRSLSDLEKLGFLKVNRKRGCENKYYFKVAPVGETFGNTPADVRWPTKFEKERS